MILSAENGKGTQRDALLTSPYKLHLASFRYRSSISKILQPDFSRITIYKSPHCLTHGLSLHPVIYFGEADFPSEWCESICLTWRKFMSSECRLLPAGPWKWCTAVGWERRAASTGRAEWTQLPGDGRYLCICQHFSIKIRRVTEVCVGVQKEQQTKTQPSISCPPGAGSGGRTCYLSLQAAIT